MGWPFTKVNVDLIKSCINNSEAHHNREYFLNQIKLNRFNLNSLHLNSPASLTRREMECIHALLKGKTAEETAQQFRLSRRTIEYYFERIKEKLNCKDKRDIIKSISKSDLYQSPLKMRN